MRADVALVVAADSILAVPVLLSLGLLLYRRLRPPCPSLPSVSRHRPLPLLLLLHLLLFCHFLPSFLSLLVPFPCPLLLVSLYLSSHALLSLLSISAVILHLHSAINTHLLPSLTALPSHSPSPRLSPSSSLSLSPIPSPFSSPYTSLLWTTHSTHTDASPPFSITITSVEGEATPCPSLSTSTPDSTPRPAEDTDRDTTEGQGQRGAAWGVSVKYHQLQWWGQWMGPGLLMAAVVALTAICITLLDTAQFTTTCPAHPPLLILQTACVLPYLLLLAYLTIPPSSLPPDLYSRRREALILLSFPLPIYLTSHICLAVHWSPYAVLLLHVSLAATSLTLTAAPLWHSPAWTPPPSPSPSPSPASATDFSGLLLSPPGSLLAYLRSALVLPELSLLHSVRAYHRLFSPSATFHLPLRNLQLDRVKQKKKRRKSSVTPSLPPSPTTSARHLERALAQAQELYQRYLCPDSPLYIPLPPASVRSVRLALHRLAADAATVTEIAPNPLPNAPGPRTGGRLVLEMRERKDAVQCLMQLGELYTDVERQVTELLGSMWVRKWLDSDAGKGMVRRGATAGGWTEGGGGTSASPSSRSTSSVELSGSSPTASPVFSAAPPPSEADGFVLGPTLRWSAPTPPVVVRGSLAHLQALHQSQQRRNSCAAMQKEGVGGAGVQGGVGWVRHARSRSISSVTTRDPTAAIHPPARRSSLGNTPSMRRPP